MAYDKQFDERMRRFQNRIIELEKASDAQDRALRQLAEKAGVEIDLTRIPTREEVSAREQAEKSGKRQADDRELLALLKESQQEEE
jgi:hypothetical protein